VGVRFSTLVQRPTQQPVKLVPSQFSEGVVAGLCFDPQPHLAPKLKESHLFSPSGLSWSFLGKIFNSSAYYMLVQHTFKLSILIVFGEGGPISSDTLRKYSCLTSSSSLSLTQPTNITPITPSTLCHYSETPHSIQL
jgi:hypothetical protein